MTWTVWLPVEERLPTERLKTKVPTVVWDRIQGSGVMVPPDAAVLLNDLWAKHLARIGREVVHSADEVPPSDAYPKEPSPGPR